MKNDWKFPLLATAMANALVYGLNALFYTFLPKYLTARFSNIDAGILLSIGPVLMILGPMFWGRLSDRSKNKNNVLFLCVAGSVLFSLAMMLHSSFGWLFAVLLFFSFFLSPFAGLIDLLTLDISGRFERNYGLFRVLGTIGFGCISLCASLFAGENMKYAFVFYAVLGLVLCLCLKAMPQVTGDSSEQAAAPQKEKGFSGVLRSPTLWLFILLFAAAQFIYAYYLNFFPNYLVQELHAPDWVWGFNVMVSTFGEIPYFLLFNRFHHRFQPRTLLFFCCGILTLRCLIFGTVTNVPVLIVTGICTVLFCTIITYCTTLYICSSIAPENRGVTQTFAYAIGNGLSKCLAGFAGGFLTDGLGYRGSSLFCALLMAVVFAVLCIARKSLPAPQKKGSLSLFSGD